jgi:hypothetical protein
MHAFTTLMIEKIACVDQVDIEILDSVYRAGVKGVFPKDVVKQKSLF